MADPTWVADATKDADEGTRKQIPATRKSTNSHKWDIMEARSKKKSEQKLVSSMPSSGHSLGVARDSDAPNMALAVSVVDALVVTPAGRSKGMGEKSPSQKVNQVESAGARRPGKCKKREVSPLVKLRETDAQYFAEVAEMDAVVAAYKRPWGERRRRGWHAGVGLAG